MSRDTPKIPPHLYRDLTAPQNAENAIAAMQSFLSDGDEEAFKAAVALYVASARHRQEPIEKVVAALTKLGTSVEGYQKHGHTLFESTRLHQLAFAGILRAFYGDVAADSRGGNPHNSYRVCL